LSDKTSDRPGESGSLGKKGGKTHMEKKGGRILTFVKGKLCGKGKKGGKVEPLERRKPLGKARALEGKN